MSGREFAQIDVSLLSSKKMRALQSNDHRWAYICTHLSPLGNFRGLFRYPLAVFAEDARLSRDDIKTTINDLRETRLIEYDHDEEIVRICGWFYKRNCPQNPSTAQSMLKDFADHFAPSNEMEARSLAEFAVGVVHGMRTWKDESQEAVKQPLREQLDLAYQSIGPAFLETLSAELKGRGPKFERDFQILLPALCDHHAVTMPAPCGHTIRDETRRDEDNKIQKKDEDVSRANVEEQEDTWARLLRSQATKQDGWS